MRYADFVINNNKYITHVTYRVLENDCQHAADYFAEENDDQTRHELKKKPTDRPL